MASLLDLPEIPDRQHISLAQNQSSPSVPFQKRTLFERSTTLRDDRCCSHAYMLPRYEHTHFLPQYWSGQNRTSRTACAGPANVFCTCFSCGLYATMDITRYHRGVGGLEKVGGARAAKILGLLIIHKGAFSSRTV